MKITLTVDRIEGERAVLIDCDGKSFVLPLEKLPEKIKEKDILTILITKGEEKNNKLAKNIINEILDA